MIKTPIVLLIFNRPDATSRVFEAIRQARPRKLFVVADGPRPDKPKDSKLVVATRAVTEAIDWPCEVVRKYSDVNLGCGNRVHSGLTAVFQEVEYAIILEDDCLPSHSFFGYCEELLIRYQDDSRVSIISGTNVTSPRNAGDTYFFSQFGGIWGWATWARSWQQFRSAKDILADKFSLNQLRKVLRQYPGAYERRIAALEEVATGKTDTWDFQWGTCRLINEGLAVVPPVNLISNIGFGPDATHTVDDSPQANRPVGEIALPLTHPRKVTASKPYDRAFLAVNGFAQERRPFTSRIRPILSGLIRGVFPNLFRNRQGKNTN